MFTRHMIRRLRQVSVHYFWCLGQMFLLFCLALSSRAGPSQGLMLQVYSTDSQHCSLCWEQYLCCVNWADPMGLGWSRSLILLLSQSQSLQFERSFSAM